MTKRLNGSIVRFLVLWLGVCVAWAPLQAADPVAASAAAAALTISSDPAGAIVYVDGQQSGVTPLSVDVLASGTHRVRVVKDGYLENARVITTAAGRTENLRVKLTARKPADAKAENAQASQGGGSSSSSFLHNPIFLIGFAAAGAGAAVALAKNNVPPVPGTFTVVPDSPSLSGVAGVTSFVFTASGAVDYDDDPLTYGWNFGDGTTATGVEATHTFASAGTYSVTLTVSDPDHTVSAGSTAITVRPALTGTWANALDPVFSCPITLSLTQTVGRLTGTVTFAGGCVGSATLTGTVQGANATYPSIVVWQTGTYSITYAGDAFTGLTMSFTGGTNQAGTTMVGPLTESVPGTPASPATTNFIKQ